ncbi:MAG: glycoside hydrolase domain-containing protein, partial [Luteolibacter sp.]
MNARLYASSILLAACMTAAAEDPIKDDTYNMPPAVVAEMGVDAAMKKMETPVTAETLDAFKKAHPAPFWLFGEDRQLAVRNNIVPAHWFQDGAKQFQKFSGVARPGEFYVLQVGLIPGDIMRPLDCGVVFDSLQGAQATVISGEDYSMSQKGERRLPYEADKLFSDPVKPIWIGLQIPENATPGTYAGRVQFRTTRFRSGIDPIIGGDDHALFVEHLAFSIKVQGEPLKESGTGEAWRLARLKWLDSKIGESDTEVTRPFTSIRVGAATRTLGILGRTITLGESGIPAQFTSFFSESNTRILDKGRDAFASAPS